MRRFARICAALGLLGALALAGPAAADAGTGLHAQTGPCPGTSAYPPTTQAMVAVSTTNPTVGETIEVSGQSYCANEDVQIYLNGTLRATAHTDGTGSFDPALIVHGPPGDQTLSGIGASGLANDRDSVVLHVQTPGGGHGTQASATEGLSLTGTDIALIIAIAVALLAGGTALAYAGRRRRSA